MHPGKERTVVAGGRETGDGRRESRIITRSRSRVALETRKQQQQQQRQPGRTLEKLNEGRRSCLLPHSTLKALEGVWVDVVGRGWE